jgi:hypothetical protein
MSSFGTSVLVLVLFIVAAPAPSRPHAQEAQHPSATPPTEAAVVKTTGMIAGSAWKADKTALPDATVRLRDVQTGVIVANALTNAGGKFRFEETEAGIYVIELVTERVRVLAVGQLFAVRPGETVTMLVRVGTKTPWFPGFFGNAATGALGAAARLGVTAVGSNGVPASPQ